MTTMIIHSVRGDPLSLIGMREALLQALRTMDGDKEMNSVGVAAGTTTLQDKRVVDIFVAIQIADRTVGKRKPEPEQKPEKKPKEKAKTKKRR